MRRVTLLCALALSAGSVSLKASDDGAPAESSRTGADPAAMHAEGDEDVAAAVEKGIALVVGMQEGDTKAEWPYEGVYRVGGQIPIGYRIGGTGIAGRAVLLSPGFEQNDDRKAAVRRAAEFVIHGMDEPLMSPDDYNGGYDVRGWGYTYGLIFLLELKRAGQVPAGLEEGVDKAIKWDIAAIQKTEIPQAGGWNYARSAGRDTVSAPSPFMTAPTLQALFEARHQGYEVSDAVVERGLKALESGRAKSGAYAYAGASNARREEQTPGAVGRMLASETTLLLAGRGSVASVRGAVDAFIVHWEWLNKRRAQPGTHTGPYSIAPYYFYYAHYFAALAVEQLPESERAEYRRRINELLFSVRLEDGRWNDRVFERTSNFGTSMACMALMMPNMPRPSAWEGIAPAATPPAGEVPVPAGSGN